ncbi:MAG: hypothetical protein LBU39_07935 [Desulfobulbaceae bacterium]|nr:hypothetical protein [Desulfobulbaceae bacterium]
MLAFLCFQKAWDEKSLCQNSIWLYTTVLCGFIATFSSGQGLLVWPILIGLWLVTAQKKALLSPSFWLFCLCSGLTIILYFYGLSQKSGQMAYVLNHPQEVWNYFLALLGASSGANITFPSSLAPVSIACGWCILIAASAIVIHFLIKRPKETLFPIAVTLWSVTVALLIAYGRASLLPINGVAGRYLTFTLPLVWTLLFYPILCARQFGKARQQVVIYSGCLVALSFLCFNMPAVWKHLGYFHAYTTNQRHILLTIDQQSDEKVKQLMAFSTVEETRRRAAILRDNNLNAFADTAETRRFFSGKNLGEPDKRSFALETLEVEQSVMNSEPSLKLRGWAFDHENGTAARTVQIKIGGRSVPLFYGVKRPNVAAYLGNSDLSAIGFQGDIPIAKLPCRSCPLALEIVAANVEGFWRVELPRQLVVGANGWSLSSPTGETAPLRILPWK